MPLPNLRGLRLLLAGLLCSATVGLASENFHTQPLAGSWRFALDREDAGIEGRWFERRLGGEVWLPGVLSAQGIGDDITLGTPWTGSIIDRSFFTAPEYRPYREPGNIKVPFWLQPTKYYAGAAWFQREVDIPEVWKGCRIVLHLERPHWETRVWLDDRSIGSNDSLSTPHEFDLGSPSPGGHTLTVRVDNRLVVDVGRDSHSVSDHTQGNWNGIVGALHLRATPPVWIDNVQVYPDSTAGSVTVRGRIGNGTGSQGQGKLVIAVRPERASQGNPPPIGSTTIQVSWQADGGTFGCTVPVRDAQCWDEFAPHLYLAEAILESAANTHDRRTVRFGFRTFGVQGTEFVINGKKTFLRGTLECCIFPKTGHPPTELNEWRRIIRMAKAHGLNNLRFHSWCPPEAAFDAADELGMYLHVECASWANASTTLGDGKPVDAWIYAEAARILRSYGNHPSFVMLLYGNEPGGDRHREFLAKWVNHQKAADSRRLYSSGAGWPMLPENEFHVTPDPRIQAWGGGLKSRINAQPPETRTDYRQYVSSQPVPAVSHEIGQWCVYPNFDEIAKYTGYLKPRNFEIFRDTLAAKGMAGQAAAFLYASGKLQALCYKEDIESALRTPGMGGFQLLDLHDFPGQGTALVGVLDPFWEEKGYISPAEFSRFCGPTVPLARLGKRVFTQDEEAIIPFEVAHFGPEPLRDIWPVFKLVGDDGRTHLRGDGGRKDVPLGNGIRLGEMRAIFGDLPVPARYKLVLGIAQDAKGEQMLCENDWDLWVYPSQADASVPQGITVTRDLNDGILETLKAGGKVVWLLPPGRVAPDHKLGKIELGFSSIFWNTAWTRRQAPHTLGVLCDPEHPLFEGFPTDSHSNWQWWYLITRAGPLILDDLPGTLRPVVQVIDDWFTARKLGLVVEAKIGAGRLLVCSIDLEAPEAANPVVRQFRQSLLRYAAGDQFNPTTELTAEMARQWAR